VRTKTSSQAEKILAVATRLFATHRFHEARMEDIAAAAEVGKGTLYRYFHDKEELYSALLDRAADQMSQRLRECTVGRIDPRAKLEAIVAAYLEYFDANPHLFDLIQHAEVMRRSDRDFRWQQTRQESIQLVQHVLEEGRRAGVFQVEDPHLAGLFLLGGLRAVMRFDKGPHESDLPARLVDLFLRGAVQTVPR
jgi:TetR/AcrR family fatty acid metabolism transcriptional regulator